MSNFELNHFNDLNNTINTQICLFWLNDFIRCLKENGFTPNYVVGHSLGESQHLLLMFFVLRLCITYKKISINGKLISIQQQLVLIGINLIIKKKLMTSVPVMIIAPLVVLSGSNEALISFREKCLERFLKLNVSGAFHSPFMEKPSTKFSEYLKRIKFKKPSFPVISNYEPSLCIDPNELKIKLENQMCNGVRWRETMDLMANDTDLHIVEIGPSNVLSGLGKKTLKGCENFSSFIF